VLQVQPPTQEDSVTVSHDDHRVHSSLPAKPATRSTSRRQLAGGILNCIDTFYTRPAYWVLTQHGSPTPRRSRAA